MTIIEGIVAVFIIATLSGWLGRDTTTEACLFCLEQKHEYEIPQAKPEEGENLK
jgi:hypothetical protein